MGVKKVTGKRPPISGGLSGKGRGGTYHQMGTPQPPRGKGTPKGTKRRKA